MLSAFGEKMSQDSGFTLIKDLMTEFADQTGLSPGSIVLRRYLWTDAFAVCNFLELYRRSRDEKIQEACLAPGRSGPQCPRRHREDDPRTGWISGLGEQEGRIHPTIGGLRIGKKLNERGLRSPLTITWNGIVTGSISTT